eukprot:12916219-Prorocentrum_lima.AAC.1
MSNDSTGEVVHVVSTTNAQNGGANTQLEEERGGMQPTPQHRSNPQPHHNTPHRALLLRMA